VKNIKRVTIGIDWELFVNSLKTGLSVGKDKLNSIIDKSKQRLPDMEVGEDIDLIELRLGMASSFSEFEEKTHRAFEVCRKTAAEMKTALVGLGYREADMNPAGGHIHAGSFESYRNAVETHNRLAPFVPAFIALAASCPSLDGKFKSLRMSHSAHNCSNPMTIICPEEGRHLWGTDVCLKYPDKPTLELRAADSQPAPELMCEIGALYLGLAVCLANREKAPFEPNIIEYGKNRMNAVQKGMASTFIIEGEEMTASKMILDYVIPLAIEGLADFGTPGGPFELAELMADKRLSVADWVKAITPTGTDKFRAAGEMTRVFNAGADPIGWLESAQPQEAVDCIPVEGHILEIVDKETPVGHVFSGLPLPRTYIERILSEMADAKKLVLTRGDRNELLVSRI